MVQPISLGLVEQVRARFFAGLPRIAFGRVVALPGTRMTTSGLEFGEAVLANLRVQFKSRVARDRQDEIMRELGGWIERAGEALDRSSVAYRSWQWYQARFELDSDPDAGAKAILALAADPAGAPLLPAIRQDLRRLRLPGVVAEGSEITIPLLRLPGNAQLVSRLAQMSGSSLGGPDFNCWRVLPVPHQNLAAEEPIVAASVAQSTGRIAMVGESGRLHVGDPNGARFSVELPSRSRSERAMVAIAAAGDMAAVAWTGEDGLALVRLGERDGRVVDLPQASEHVTSRLHGKVTCMAWAGNASRLAFGSAYEGVVMMDNPLASGGDATVGVSDTGIFSRAIALTPDGSLTVLGSGDTLYLRQAAEILNAGHVSPDAPPRVITSGLSEITAIAVGSGGWPIAAAGAGLLVVLPESRVRLGPWPIPPGLVTELRLLDGKDVAVAVLAGEQMAIIQASTGLNLLLQPGEESSENGPTTGHATLGIDRQLAVVFTSDRRGLQSHAVEVDREGETDAAAA